MPAIGRRAEADYKRQEAASSYIEPSNVVPCQKPGYGFRCCMRPTSRKSYGTHLGGSPGPVIRIVRCVCSSADSSQRVTALTITIVDTMSLCGVAGHLRAEEFSLAISTYWNYDCPLVLRYASNASVNPASFGVVWTHHCLPVQRRHRLPEQSSSILIVHGAVLKVQGRGSKYAQVLDCAHYVV